MQGEPGPEGPQGVQGIQGDSGPQGATGQEGPPGAQGPQGPPFASAVVDATTTLPAGDPAQVSSWFDGSTVHLSFGIPRGYDGLNGTNGTDGQQGPQGPPFASAVVDGTTTLPPQDAAQVSSWFDGTNVHLSFAIPRGYDGAQGPQGEPGPQGPPGEVTASQLDDAIATTARNLNTVQPLDIAISDPPTQAEVQALMDKINEVIAAGTRVAAVGGRKGQGKRDKG